MIFDPRKWIAQKLRRRKPKSSIGRTGDSDRDTDERVGNGGADLYRNRDIGEKEWQVSKGLLPFKSNPLRFAI
jgi:hypothetical protein